MNERDFFDRYGRMRAWVERERRRLARTGERPSQTYLRRARLLIDIDPRSLRELLRELKAITKKNHG